MHKYGMMMAGGILGLVALKLAMTFVVPALMVLFAFLAVFVKVSIFIAIGFIVFAIFRKFARPRSGAEA
jgi:hypothetical protein